MIVQVSRVEVTVEFVVLLHWVRQSERKFNDYKSKEKRSIIGQSLKKTISSWSSSTH